MQSLLLGCAHSPTLFFPGSAAALLASPPNRASVACLSGSYALGKYKKVAALQFRLMETPVRLKTMGMGLSTRLVRTQTVDSAEVVYQDSGAEQISRIVTQQAGRRLLAGALQSEMFPQRLAALLSNDKAIVDATHQLRKLA